MITEDTRRSVGQVTVTVHRPTKADLEARRDEIQALLAQLTDTTLESCWDLTDELDQINYLLDA